MQSYSGVFLSLWLAHLLGDFVLQPERMLSSKRRFELRGHLEHGAIHFLLAALSLAVFIGLPAPWIRTLAAVLGLAAVHAISDYAKLLVGGRGRIDSWNVFLLDQGWHMATIAAAARVVWPGSLSDLRRAAGWWQAEGGKLLPALVVYAAVVFAGGYLVRHLTRPLLESMTLEGGQTVKQLRNAGMYIGWLERFLILSALVLQSPATMGLILAAKSIVRFPELKDLRFAEYFLVGTLLSISIALLGGMILIRGIYGSLSLK